MPACKRLGSSASAMIPLPLLCPTFLLLLYLKDSRSLWKQMENRITMLFHLTGISFRKLWGSFPVSPGPDASLQVLVDPQNGQLRPFSSR